MTANAYQPDSGPVIEVDIAAVEKTPVPSPGSAETTESR
jgi:hypothetical protein